MAEDNPDILDNLHHAEHAEMHVYGLATAISWLFWFSSAYLNHLGAGSPAYGFTENLLGAVGLSIPVIIASFMIIGLAAPMIIAFIMMLSTKHLKNGLRHTFLIEQQKVQGKNKTGEGRLSRGSGSRSGTHSLCLMSA
jgi:uncharacterized membrane protein YgcG